MKKLTLLRTLKLAPPIPLLTVLISFIFILPVHPTKAVPTEQAVWILTETLVNPNNGQLEYYGGGATPGWFSEPRFEGKFTKYGGTDSSFRIEDREVDHGYEYHHVTIETSFQKPPMVLIPGQTIALTANFSHSGTAEDGGVGVQFWYDGQGIDIQPPDVFHYSPWAAAFDGANSATYTFDVPAVTSGGEFEIYASWWNAEPCLVVWKFRVQDAGETPTEAVAPTAAPAPTQQQEIPKIELDPDDYVTSSDTLAGKVLGITGDVTVILNDDKQQLSKGDQIWVGSCIKTGPQGLVRIRMNDILVDDEWVDQTIPGNKERIQEVVREQGNINPTSSRVSGPTFINLGANSELCIEAMQIDFRDPTIFSGLLGLIEGKLRAYISRETINASFDVRAGIAICGIRGSDVFISYDPNVELVQAQVIEGHMDVTSELTGETQSLFDNQQVVVTEGEIIDLGTLSQEEWDSNLEAYGLRDADFPDTEVEISFEQDTRPLYTGYIFILGFIMVCGAALLGGLVVIFLVRKKVRQ